MEVTFQGVDVTSAKTADLWVFYALFFPSKWTGWKFARVTSAKMPYFCLFSLFGAICAKSGNLTLQLSGQNFWTFYEEFAKNLLTTERKKAIISAQSYQYDVRINRRRLL